MMREGLLRSFLVEVKAFQLLALAQMVEDRIERCVMSSHDPIMLCFNNKGLDLDRLIYKFDEGVEDNDLEDGEIPSNLEESDDDDELASSFDRDDDDEEGL
jgi:hypothetical protein